MGLGQTRRLSMDQVSIPHYKVLNRHKLRQITPGVVLGHRFFAGNSGTKNCPLLINFSWSLSDLKL